MIRMYCQTLKSANFLHYNVYAKKRLKISNIAESRFYDLGIVKSESGFYGAIFGLSVDLI